jgi:hypothetical protein
LRGVKLKATVLALTAALAIGALAGPSASAQPTAGKSAEDLVRFLTKGKLKVKNKISYLFQCARDCDVTVTLRLVVPGVKAPPDVASGSFTAGIPIKDGFKPSGPLQKAIREGGGKSKLKSTIVANIPTTGENDVDRRTFKFK